MPKILIVDDETIFRKGLRSMISAMDQDWEVVGEARDGYEALDMLQTLQPEVLLTDIRMPRMDGIQLQQVARERFPDLLCVVISGYDDFTYVRQSLRQGAKDYVMKPIERDELARVLGEMKRKLANKAQRDSKAIAPKEDYLIRQHVSEHLIAGFLRGSMHESELQLLQKIGVDFTHPYYMCIVIKMDKSSVGRDRFKRADPSLFHLYIQQFAQEILNRRAKAFCFVMSDTDVVGLLNLPHPSAMDHIAEAAETIRKQIKSLSNLTVTIGMGQPAEGIRQIPRTYNEAEIALLYRLIVGGDKVLDYAQTAAGRAVQTGMKKWSWEALEQSINEGRPEETSRRVETVITDLCRQAKNPEAVHQQVCKLLIHYYELALELGISKRWLGEKDIRSVLVDVCSLSARDELIEACRTLLTRLTECIGGGTAPFESGPLDKSLRFIERHFDQPVTLKEVADAVYLNPAYFSTLFKQRTGKSFIEKLTEIRVEAAKKRLAFTGDKIAVIAEKTGFANIRHFNRVFKKETGVTPKDFRDRIRSSHEPER